MPRRPSRAKVVEAKEKKLQYHTKRFEKYTPDFKFMRSRLLTNLLIFLGAVVLGLSFEHVSLEISLQ